MSVLPARMWIYLTPANLLQSTQCIQFVERTAVLYVRLFLIQHQHPSTLFSQLQRSKFQPIVSATVQINFFLHMKIRFLKTNSLPNIFPYAIIWFKYIITIFVMKGFTDCLPGTSHMVQISRQKCADNDIRRRQFSCKYPSDRQIYILQNRLKVV